MTIPKIIHYVWVGKNPIPSHINDCINTWKKYCPDYQIIQWDEDNFNIDSNKFAKEAYSQKMWAFVSDYIRLAVLYKYGGIYLDTDMELIQNLDGFLQHRAFSAFESPNYISAGIIGTEKESQWIGEILEVYQNKSFIREDGSLDKTTTPQTITKITERLSPDMQFQDMYQELSCGLVLYPSEYFYPLDPSTSLMKISENTHAIHHFDGSWTSTDQQKTRDLKRTLSESYPYLHKINKTTIGHKLLRIIIPVYTTYKLKGIKYCICAFINKIFRHMNR